METYLKFFLEKSEARHPTWTLRPGLRQPCSSTSYITCALGGDLNQQIISQDSQVYIIWSHATLFSPYWKNISLCLSPCGCSNLMDNISNFGLLKVQTGKNWNNSTYRINISLKIKYTTLPSNYSSIGPWKKKKAEIVVSSSSIHGKKSDKLLFLTVSEHTRRQNIKKSLLDACTAHRSKKCRL